MRLLSLQRYVAVLLFTALLSSCATWGRNVITYTMKKEFREFPEYAGFLPVAPVGSTRIVAAEWVLPAPVKAGPQAYDLPKTAEEAERIVDARAKKDRNEKISTIPLQAAGTVVGIALYPLFIISEPFHHAGAPQHEKTSPDIRSEHLNADIDIQVNGPDGRGVSGVQYLEIASPLRFKTYLNGAGKRSFAPLGSEPYPVDSRLAALLAKHLPIHLGRYFVQRPGVSIPLGSVEHPFRFQRADASGRIRFMSKAAQAGRQGESGDGTAGSAVPGPSPHVIIWAPGYHPAVHTVMPARAGTDAQTIIALQPLENRDAVIAASAAFEDMLAALEQKYSVSLFRKTEKEDTLRSMAGQMRSWIMNKDLPGYFRWNVHQVLASRVVRNDAPFEAVFKETAPLAAELGPFLEPGEQNPWALNDAYSQWRSRIRSAQYSGKPFSAEEFESIADDARALFARAEPVVPGYPLLNDLRVAIASYEGDREQALQLSRYMGHDAFFYLYYRDRYRVELPPELR